MSSSTQNSTSRGRKAGTKAKVYLGRRPWIESGVEDVGEAREVFLSRIPEHAPGVLKGLLPVFQAYERERLSVPGVAPNIGAATLRWAGKYHLTFNGEVPEWVYAQVLSTFADWQRQPDWVGLHWVSLVGYWHCETGLAPKRQTRAAELARIPRYRKLLGLLHGGSGARKEEALRYRNAMGPLAKALDLQPLPFPMMLEHFIWAVRFQCDGEHINDIAADPGGGARSNSAVTRAVSIVLDLIGLDRRRVRKS